ncbi:MAG: glycosyl transferase family 1 [Chloroflexi bacterium RBG_13_52_12]|nr:MAG: glycosyl transferase family 1 [Chloroflexi bacterium RBG_13_52_12]
MKIALVSPYDFASPGGVVSHISCLEQQFTRMGHEVKIIAPASKAFYTSGDRFIRIGTPRPVPVSGSIARVTISLWLESKIKEVFEREKFDICHLHEPLMPTLCTTVLRLKKAPMVGTFHASGGKPWYTMFSPVMKWYLDRWFRKLDGRIAVSEVALRYVNTFFPANYQIIANGVDTHHFNNAVTPLDRFNDEKLNILFVGRLEKRKGFDYLLEAYRLIKPEVPDCRLIQVGPGVRLRKKCEKRISRYGIPDVNLTGYATYADLPRYYKTADIVCFPATGRESQGIVLLEAMSAGKPVIASDIDGYSSVLTDGVEGIAVPPRNADKLAEAILRLARDKQLREQMGARGKPRAMQYEWSLIASKLIDFYTATLNNIKRTEPEPEKDIPEISAVSGKR